MAKVSLNLTITDSVVIVSVVPLIDPVLLAANKTIGAANPKSTLLVVAFYWVRQLMMMMTMNEIIPLIEEAVMEILDCQRVLSLASDTQTLARDWPVADVPYTPSTAISRGSTYDPFPKIDRMAPIVIY